MAQEGVIKLTSFYFSRIEETLKEIQRRNGRPARIREPPGCFPFTVLDNLLNFGDVDQQTYDNVVNINFIVEWKLLIYMSLFDCDI